MNNIFDKGEWKESQPTQAPKDKEYGYECKYVIHEQ